jgi:hypothetical protein
MLEKLQHYKIETPQQIYGGNAQKHQIRQETQTG